MTYQIRENCIFEHVDVFETEEELLKYLHEVSAPLGQLMMEFNALEDEITMFLMEAYEILGLPINVELLQKFYSRKSQELIKCYKQLSAGSTDLRKSVSKLNDLLKSSADTRNQFMHASWLYASPTKGVACSEINRFTVSLKFQISKIATIW
ncbi:hypothetical protein [Photobacterium indicum]|uniref:Uncharacterized protein n=1 Tax=Photobacterium indicum TaxID=81447 RepID=A0A2T3LEQ3_9GAMM|nr:hypothetical protein [Photobacterium indicum]PSV49854.1 hypothetical protein C9J47_04700 [Photobacterium indicum]